MASKALTEDYLLEISGCMELSDVRQLNLSSLGLTTLDPYLPVLKQLESLESLNLSRNKLHSFPDDLHLPSLMALDCRGNKLKCLSFVRHCPNLKELYIHGNPDLITADRYIATALCRGLLKIDDSRNNKLQSNVKNYRAGLVAQVENVWANGFADKYSTDIPDEEFSEVLQDFMTKLEEQKLPGQNSQPKFRVFMIDQMARELLASVISGNYIPTNGKASPARNRIPTMPRTPIKIASEKKFVTRTINEPSTVASISPLKDISKAVNVPRTGRKRKASESHMSRLPPVGEYEPVHFIRCHSADNTPDNDTGKVWSCAFEPCTADPTSSTHIVAACGENIVCLLDCTTGHVMRRYKDDDPTECFNCLAWSTMTLGSSHGDVSNILAIAGQTSVIYLLHPSQLVLYGSLTGHNKAINCLMFHPEEPTWLFRVTVCISTLGGSDDQTIVLWDIGVPDLETYTTKHSKLLALSCPGNSVLNMVFSSSLMCLIAGCDDGCYGFTLDSKNFDIPKIRKPDVKFSLPEEEESDIVDGLVLLPNDIVATKTAAQGCISLWNLNASMPSRKSSSMREVDVSQLARLEYSSSKQAYMNMAASSDLIAVGDDDGGTYLYNVKSLVQKQKSSLGEFAPSSILEWPSLTYKFKQAADKDTKPILNCAAVSADNKYIVCGTDNNMVCIWCKTSAT